MKGDLQKFLDMTNKDQDLMEKLTSLKDEEPREAIQHISRRRQMERRSKPTA